jgi:rRNA maturation endonuclease Nob1
MKCQNCEQDIPAKFVYALSTNTCPFCGENIMDEVLQEAIVAITTTMSSVGHFKDELFTWLKSNYNLVSLEDHESKVAELEVQLASIKPHHRQHLANEHATTTAPISKFMLNAGVKEIKSKEDHFKNLVSTIQSEAVEEPMTDFADDSNLSEADVYNDLRSNLAVGGNTMMDGAEHNPDRIMAMMGGARGPVMDKAQMDLNALAISRNKARIAAEEMAATGSVGKIRR